MNTSITLNTNIYYQPKDELRIEEKGAKALEKNTKQFANDIKSLQKPLSLESLRDLIARIISLSKELKNQVYQQSIIDNKTNCLTAETLANKKCTDAQRKHTINLISSSATMAITTCSTISAAKPVSLKDKHLASINGGNKTSVKDLDANTINKFRASMQEDKTAKCRSVNQLADMSNNLVSHGNEIQNAASSRDQEKMQAELDLKKKNDELLNTYKDDLAKEMSSLLALLDEINNASAANSR